MRDFLQTVVAQSLPGHFSVSIFGVSFTFLLEVFMQIQRILDLVIVALLRIENVCNAL